METWLLTVWGRRGGKRNFDRAFLTVHVFSLARGLVKGTGQEAGVLNINGHRSRAAADGVKSGRKEEKKKGRKEKKKKIREKQARSPVIN